MIILALAFSLDKFNSRPQNRVNLSLVSYII